MRSAYVCFVLCLIVASCSAASLGFRGGVFYPSVDEQVFNVAWFKTCSAEMFLGPSGAWDAQATLPAFPVEMVVDIAALPTLDTSEPYKSVAFNATLPGVSTFSLTISGAVSQADPPVFLPPATELLQLGPVDAIEPATASFVLGQFNGLSFRSALFDSNGDQYQVQVDGFFWQIVNLSTIPSSPVATGYFQTCCQAPSPYLSDLSACVACNRACDDTCDMPSCP